MSDTEQPAEQASQAPYTLHFTEWHCGHHGQRPADIPVHSTEQAQLILQAIANAISQPGHARCALLSDERTTTAYLTDDYAEEISEPQCWSWRTVVYHGSEEEIAALARLAQAFDDCYGGELAIWDGKSHLDDHLEVATTLTAEVVAAACAHVEWYEEGTRREVCTVPPVIKPASMLLTELREYVAQADGSPEADTQGGAQS